MQDSQAPAKIPLLWAWDASPPYITAGGIPVASQQSVKSGAASFFDGFPPLCFVPISTGGAGPYGADFNAVLQQVTAGLQWLQAGGPMVLDGTFSGTIGGYPNGALVASGVTAGLWWRSTVDNNTSNPDVGGANWVAVYLPGPSNFFGQPAESAGYQVLPSGLIIQWGVSPNVTLITGYHEIFVTFPIAFPHVCLQVVATDDGIFIGGITNTIVYACSTFTQSNFILTGASPNNPANTGTYNARFIAIGY